MSEPQNKNEDESKARFDKSLNVPTLLTMLAMMAAFWWWGTVLYADLRLSDAKNATDIVAVKADVHRIETRQNDQARDVRDDLKNINDKLDRLADRLTVPRNAKEWTK